MKRTIVLGIALFGVVSIVTSPGIAGAQEAGGGFSVFVPEALYEYEEGSISIETRFETSVGLVEGVSIPVGVTVNQVYGLVPSNRSDKYEVSGPWFYADTLSPYVNIRGRVPVTDGVYVDAFGGLFTNWNMTARPLTDRIERDISAVDADERRLVFDSRPEVRTSFGLGFNAGLGVGVDLDFGAIELSASYRSATSRVDISGDADWFGEDGSGEPTVDSTELTLEDIRVRLRGISLGAGVRVRL
ncbi:MAG: hypothetical protein ACLFM0_10825 [Spirochaetales bacterium]